MESTIREFFFVRSWIVLGNIKSLFMLKERSPHWWSKECWRSQVFQDACYTDLRFPSARCCSRRNLSLILPSRVPRRAYVLFLGTVSTGSAMSFTPLVVVCSLYSRTRYSPMQNRALIIHLLENKFIVKLLDCLQIQLQTLYNTQHNLLVTLQGKKTSQWLDVAFDSKTTLLQS